MASFRPALGVPAAVLALGACAPASAPATAPVPSRATAAARDAADPGIGLPPVPRVDGALDVRVVSPIPDQIVPRDSTFVFGSVGSGAASVTVNGAPVDVAPNGAFLAYLPTPPASAPRYDVVATRGADVVRRSVAVRVAGHRTTTRPGALVVDSGSVTPDVRMRVPTDEAVRVGVRASRGARAWLELPGSEADTTASMRVPLVDAVGARGEGGADADALTVWATDVRAARLIGAGARARVVAARGADTVRLPIARVEALGAPDSRDDRREYVQLGRPEPVRPGAIPDTDRVVIGRPTPDGTYRYFFLPGTVLERTAVVGGLTRVRLDRQLQAWVDGQSVLSLPTGYAPARRIVGAARIVPARDWADLVLPMADRPAYEVFERGRDVDLVLHGVTLSPDIFRLEGTATDSLVRQVIWEQQTDDRVRLTLRLGRDPYGYLVLWDPARSALVLRVRRPPPIDPARPLAGLTIVVDPGHPPGGATGPTGLWEPVAVLPVGERVRDLLRARGATVLMTRTTADPVGLAERPLVARRANAHAFVSVHLNALPDGINPFVANGSSTLFFHQHAEPLARALQAQLVRRLALRDLGIHYQNLAVARPTWVPEALTEGLFLMLPAQEAAMRTPEGRERYARAIVDGLEDYFRALAGR
ncbi:MAG TPA: N-acetylmuramoyl-L-alanine amidase [Gemmatirosa sp.]